jgi:hypothetical protein
MHHACAADDGPVRLSFRSSPFRSFSPAGPGTVSPRRLALALCGSVATVSVALLLGAAPAGAVVQEIGVGGPKVGVQPREVSRYFEGTRKWSGLGKNEAEANAAAKTFDNLKGAPVLHAVNTYVIYWDPQHFYHGDWQHTIDQFMEHMGTASGEIGNVFAVDAEYTDTTDQPAADHFTFNGAAVDTNPYPAPSGCADPRPFEPSPPLFEVSAPLVEGLSVCLTDAQVRTQLETFITQHSLHKGMHAIFYLLTPPGVAVCLDAGGVAGHCSEFGASSKEIETDEQEKVKKEEKSEPYVEPAGYVSYKQSFCSYHDASGSGEATLLYAVIPWTAGGQGDNQLAGADKEPGYDCQDGGFEPGKQPNGELEEKEQEKPHTLLEEEEYAKKNAEEKRKQLEAEALKLDGPHEQEPNQLTTRSEDGAFDTGLADLIINQIAVELQNTVTDPLLNAWQDSAGREVSDECRNLFDPIAGGSAGAGPQTLAGTLYNQVLGGNNYYLNDSFDLAALKLNYPGVPCLAKVRLEPHFTAPNPVNAGEVVGFDGMESDISLNWARSFANGAPTETYPKYTWNFGDESPTVSGYAPATPSVNSPGSSPCASPWLAPCAGGVFHSYEYGGTYDVTLTVTDTGGNTASVTEPITVNGPSRPTPSPPGGGSSTPATSGAGSSPVTGSSSTSLVPTKAPGLSPIASAAAVPSSLAKTTRKGLTVRYSVNQQVAGRFEVLLAASIAHRIGLHPPLATNLPAGTPPQVVVGKAILITTQGGRGTLKIQFGKITGARLRHLGKVSLMLRLNLRNSAGGTTTLLSKFTLR